MPVALKRRLLIVTHNLGGGVERHVADLSALLSAQLEVDVLRPCSAQVFELCASAQEPVFWKVPAWPDLVRALDARCYDWVSFHHIHAYPPEILQLASDLALPYDVVLHDYLSYCPIYSLTTAQGTYCGEPDASGCTRCLAQRPHAWQWDILHWRDRMAQWLGAAQRILAPSQFVAQRVTRNFPALRPTVWSHPAREDWLQAAPTLTKVLLLGKITRAKGLDALLACAQQARAGKLPLAFVVLGYTEVPIEESQGLAVRVAGEYTDTQLPQLLALERADVVWFPGPYPETHGYTLDVALASGLPLVASDFGAVAERIASLEHAVLLPRDASASDWCAALLKAAALPHGTPAHTQARQERAAYAGRYAAPILQFKRGAGAQSAPAVDLAGLEQIDWLEPMAAPALPALYEAGVVCGHRESRLVLKDRLEEVERDYAVLTAHARRVGLPWYEILDEAVPVPGRGDQGVSVISYRSRLMDLEQEILALRSTLRGAHDEGERLHARLQAERDTLEQKLQEHARDHEAWQGAQQALETQLQRVSADLQHQTADLARANQRINELESSTSWRVTAPLRLLGHARNALGSGVRRAGRFTRHAWQRLPLALRIVRADGWAALWDRVQRRYGRASFTPPLSTTAGLVPMTALALGTCTSARKPRVSIVIPVYAHEDHTFHCLHSLGRHTRLGDVEIIVVDDASPQPTEGVLAGVSGVQFLRAKRNGGFIESCHLGANRARGEFLVLLNNDIEVTAGWLEHLLAVFDTRSDAGLVGARLVYPNGQLQEAGGIVWQDGSAWNWGRGDDPAQPPYAYVRAVDYCSGACLALRRDDWIALGGFDRHYAPAYYEDNDLAFRMRELGKRVYYQPAATIIHFEGISSGTDESSGIKQYQVTNREKFFARWQATLRTHRPNGQMPRLEANRTARARALVVEACMLTPDQDSGSVRMLAMLELMVELGCQVSFVADNLEYREPYVQQLQQRGVEVWHHPYVSSVADLLARLGGEYDSIILCRHYIASPYMADIRRWAAQARIVFDTVDLHYLREQRLAELDGSTRLLQTAESTRKQELQVIRDCDVTLVVSPVEQALLAKEVPGAQVEIVSNIHALREGGLAFAQRSGLLFVGGFRHPPNVDAVNWFVDEVWPLVLARSPSLTCTIVGSNMPRSIQALQASGLVVAGFVEDIEPLLDAARISIAPLRYGAGVKGKINQAMACGLPVVATTAAAEGMDLCDGADLLVADTAQAFADAIVRLHGDEVLWNQLALGGRRNIQAQFSRERARQTLERVLGLKHTAQSLVA